MGQHSNDQMAAWNLKYLLSLLLWGIKKMFTPHGLTAYPSPTHTPSKQFFQLDGRELHTLDLYLAHWRLLLCLCKGLPKAATINHQRLWYGTGLALASGINAHDIIYTTMPLYHSAALLIGLHGCIVAGKFCFSPQASGVDTRSYLLLRKSRSSCFPVYQSQYSLGHQLQGSVVHTSWASF